MHWSDDPVAAARYGRRRANLSAAREQGFDLRVITTTSREYAGVCERCRALVPIGDVETPDATGNLEEHRKWHRSIDDRGTADAW